jgi:protein-tyrosine phosphatase
MALQHGVGPSAALHRAQLLGVEHLDDIDLALAMARDHRREIVELNPALVRRTFTVRELDRLMAGLSDADLLAAADTAAAKDDPRSRLVPMLGLIQTQRAAAAIIGNGDADDVEDPYGRSAETYERSTAQLARALPGVERLIRMATL